MSPKTKKPATGLRPAKSIIGDLDVEELLSAPPKVARQIKRPVRRVKRVVPKPIIALASGLTTHFKEHEYVTNITIAFFGFLAIILALLAFTLQSLRYVPRGF